MMGKIVSILTVSLFILVISGSAASDILLNGTKFYLSTGDSYGLFQGYIVKIKSVSNERSVWLELTSNDILVKSEITHFKGSFIYNKTNRTVLSLTVDNIYSGTRDISLVSFFPVYQYIDPDLPSPKTIEITPVETREQNNYSSSVPEQSVNELVIWLISILSILILFYIVYKYW